MSSIPQAATKLLEGKNFARLATLMPDGSPQVTPVWVDRDGDTVLINTARGRLKERNLARDARVALSVTDEQNPYESLAIRGSVTGISGEGADQHIDALAKRYLGVDEYPLRQPGEERVIIRIEPGRVMHYGG